MRHGFGFRDFFLLFLILGLVGAIFSILIFLPAGEQKAGADFYSPSEMNAADDIISQNKYLRQELDRLHIEKEMLLRNISILNSIINEQDKLIIRMHERLGTYQEGIETISPADRIEYEEIIVDDKAITIKLPSARKGTIIDTHSELPLLNENATTLEVSPKTEQDVHIGDIIVYYSNTYHAYIIHRVISQGFDKDGWFVITKGDNNFLPDDELIRFPQIKSIVVGIIY